MEGTQAFFKVAKRGGGREPLPVSCLTPFLSVLARSGTDKSEASGNGTGRTEGLGLGAPSSARAPSASAVQKKQAVHKKNTLAQQNYRRPAADHLAFRNLTFPGTADGLES